MPTNELNQTILRTELDSSIELHSACLPVTLNNVPVPDELPSTFDPSILPANIARSGVVDSLIKQNQEIISRLHVQLKRNAAYEQEIEDLHTQLKSLAFKKNVLEDQVEVLKQKSAHSENKQQEQQNKSSQLSEEFRVLEIRYVELKQASEERTSKLVNAKEALSRRLRSHLKYRAKIKIWTNAIRAKLNEAIHQAAKNHQEINRLSDQVEESAKYIQQQRNQFDTDIKELAAQYQRKLDHLEESVNDKEQELSSYKVRVSKLDKAYDEKIVLHNDYLHLQRHSKETIEKQTNMITDLQEKLQTTQSKGQALNLENRRLEQERADLIERLEAGEDLTERLQEQVENLQSLWHDNQNEIRTLKERQDSLQKLNQQLSFKLNEERNSLKQIKLRSQANEDQSRNILKKVQEELRLLKSSHHS